MNEKHNDTVEHYNAILLEDIKSKMELVIEGMESTRTSLQGEMREIRKDLHEVKQTVDGHTVAILELSAGQRQLKTELRTEMKEMEVRITKNVDRKLEDLSDKFDHKLENVSNRLSDKIDTIGQHIGDHEHRIGKLERAANG